MTETLKEQLMAFAARVMAGMTDEESEIHGVLVRYVDQRLDYRHPDDRRLAPEAIAAVEEAIEADENVAAVVREQVEATKLCHEWLVPAVLASMAEGTIERGEGESISPRRAEILRPLESLVADATGCALTLDQMVELDRMLLRYGGLGEPLDDITTRAIDILKRTNPMVGALFVEQEEVDRMCAQPLSPETEAASARIPKDLPIDEWVKAFLAEVNAQGKSNP